MKIVAYKSLHHTLLYAAGGPRVGQRHPGQPGAVSVPGGGRQQGVAGGRGGGGAGQAGQARGGEHAALPQPPEDHQQTHQDLD